MCKNDEINYVKLIMKLFSDIIQLLNEKHEID